MSASSSESGRRARRSVHKVKTGCKTCRSRRVKCDETKPSCMRCILAAKECLGYLYGRSPAASPESDSTDSNTGQVEDALVKLDLAESQPRGYRQQSTNFNIPMELLPKEWHFAESRSFIYSVVKVHYKDSQLIPSAFHYLIDPSEPSNSKVHAVIAQALAMRLILFAETDENGLRKKEHYVDQPLWTALYSHIRFVLEDINRNMDRDAKNIHPDVLTKICNIKQAELALQSPTWRPHTEGFLKLLHLCFKDFLSTFSQYELLTVNDIMIEAVMCNAISPPDKQITELANFSKTDMLHVYRWTSNPAMPCPSLLMWEFLELIELRVRIHQAAEIGQDFMAEVEAVFKRIAAFDTNNWTESYPIPDTPETRLMPEIFQLTMELYGLQALPLDVLTYVESLKATIHDRRDRLLELIGRIWVTPTVWTGFNWQLAVVGCTLTDGTDEQRAFVSKCLDNISEDPFTNHPLMIKSMLEKFWASGKTEWSDCWTTGFVILY